MGRTTVAQAGLRFARVGITKLPNLSFFVDAEAFNVTVAFHFGGPHNATHVREGLLDRKYHGNRARRLPFGIFPVRLNLALPSAVQVRKRNKPALQAFPAPAPLHEKADKKKVGSHDFWDRPHEINEVLHVEPAGRGDAKPYQPREYHENEEKRLQFQVLHDQPSNPM